MILLRSLLIISIWNTIPITLRSGYSDACEDCTQVLMRIARHAVTYNIFPTISLGKVHFSSIYASILFIYLSMARNMQVDLRANAENSSFLQPLDFLTSSYHINPSLSKNKPTASSTISHDTHSLHYSESSAYLIPPTPPC